MLGGLPLETGQVGRVFRAKEVAASGAAHEQGAAGEGRPRITPLIDPNVGSVAQ